jgi:hypothetical protein
MSDTEDIVFSRKVVEFVAVGNEFCELVENCVHYDTPQLIEITRKLLSLLYFKASVLPAAERVLDEEVERYVSELDYNVYLQKWLNKLGEHDLYHEVFDPEIQFGSEAVTASISESILDIYQDVKDFVSAYNFGNEEVMNDALCECIERYRNAWGQRLVNVLRAIHQLAFADIDWSDTPLSYYKPDDESVNQDKWIDRFFNQDTE